MPRQLTLAQLIVILSAAVTLLFSFFPFLGVSGFDAITRNAWGSGIFPLGTYPAVIAAAIGVLVAITALGGVKLPDRVVTFSWPQIYAAAALFALLIMLGYLILEKGSLTLQYGAVLMLLGTVGLVIGTTMELLGKGGDVVVGAHQPSTQATPPPPNAPATLDAPAPPKAPTASTPAPGGSRPAAPSPPPPPPPPPAPPAS